MSNDKKGTIKQRRDALKLLGTAWVTPTIVSATIPAHAQTSGLFCGGMESVSGHWDIDFENDANANISMNLNDDGIATDITNIRFGKWSINGSELKIYDFDSAGNVTYVASLSDNCKEMEGRETVSGARFTATKNDNPPPPPA